MLPATKRCRTHLAELNEHYQGVVIALKPGDLTTSPIRFEILSFERFRGAIHLTDSCTVVVRCLDDEEPGLFTFRPYKAGETYDFPFALSRIDELLTRGLLHVRSHVHAEDWYRPDMQCQAV